MNKRLLTFLIMGTVGLLTVFTIVANNGSIFFDFYNSGAATSMDQAQGEVVAQLNDIASQLHAEYINPNFVAGKNELINARAYVRRARSYVIRKRYGDSITNLNNAVGKIDNSINAIGTAKDTQDIEDTKADINAVLTDITDLKNGTKSTANGSTDKFAGTPECDRGRLLGELQFARNQRLATSNNFPGAGATAQCVNSGDWRYVYTNVFPKQWNGTIISANATTREDCTTLAAAAKTIELAAYSASPNTVYPDLAKAAGYNDAIFNQIACKPTSNSLPGSGGSGSRGGQGTTPTSSAACDKLREYSACAATARQSCINSTANECEFYCNAQTVQNNGGDRSACNACNAQHFTACTNSACGPAPKAPAGTICTTQ